MEFDTDKFINEDPLPSITAEMGKIRKFPHDELAQRRLDQVMTRLIKGETDEAKDDAC